MVGKKSTGKRPHEKHKIPELITLDEACELLKVHPNTLRKWDKEGILPAIRIGAKRVYRYKRKDIIKFLQSKS